MDALRHSFVNPPAASRPMVRWWWFGTAVEKPELLRELQQMKSDGIGGAELAFVYPVVVDDSAKGLENFAFLSSEMLEAVRYVQVEARKLGLRIDLTLCSGWPYGGPATTLAEAAGRLRTVEVDLPPTPPWFCPLSCRRAKLSFRPSSSMAGQPGARLSSPNPMPRRPEPGGSHRPQKPFTRPAPDPRFPPRPGTVSPYSFFKATRSSR